jgi:hypothetical protein
MDDYSVVPVMGVSVFVVKRGVIESSVILAERRDIGRQEGTKKKGRESWLR